MPVNLIADLFTIGLSCFGFIEQYLLFRKQKTTGQFSIYITAIMVFSSILKIMFYFLKPYGMALFIQNFLLIAIALLITHKYVEINHTTIKKGNSLLERFWNWTTFEQYLSCAGSFAIVVGFLVYFSIQNQWLFVGEGLASLATLIEIGLALPQIIKIAMSKNANGISVGMIGIWLCSDVYKTVYFIFKDQPLQFIATGAIQALLDVVLLLQLKMYSSPAVVEGKKAE